LLRFARQCALLGSGSAGFRTPEVSGKRFDHAHARRTPVDSFVSSRVALVRESPAPGFSTFEGEIGDLFTCSRRTPYPPASATATATEDAELADRAVDSPIVTYGNLCCSRDARRRAYISFTYVWHCLTQQAGHSDRHFNVISLDTPSKPPSNRPSERFTFIAHGVRVEIVADERHVLEQSVALLPVGWRQTDFSEVDASCRFSIDPSGFGHVLTLDGEHVAGPAALHEVLERFEPLVTVRVAERAPNHVFVHAGVVGWQGRGIVLPGYSFAGKTTLVAELVRAGAFYYSDEYAVLDRDGRVHPYPRPLQIRKPGERRQTRLSVRELGGTAGSEPLEVDLIVFCKYKPGANWRPRNLTAGRAALEMFQYTMSAQYAPEAALSTLRRVVSRATLLKGTRGETAPMIDFIAQSFSG
jgi:hypothetical protein